MDHCLHPCSSFTFNIVHAIETVFPVCPCSPVQARQCALAGIDSTVIRRRVSGKTYNSAGRSLAMRRAEFPIQKQGVPRVRSSSPRRGLATRSLPLCLQNVLHFSVLNPLKQKWFPQHMPALRVFCCHRCCS
uniref:Uncharacterized protein n=1 Tax=Myotis myotis TaxID=51298 RepID=A0A7J7XHN2_MYOMY|nr:hypothetical protein mMyoMyo1_011605 [Myotis myotis]